MTRACCLLLLCAALAGCGKTTTATRTDGGRGESQKTDPWDATAKKLRKDNDLAATRTALTALNSDLASRPEVPAAPPLTADAEKAITALVPLSPSDLTEVRPGAFSNLDPTYLADCLYLRDAAKAVAPASAPPSRAADLAFAFVCRQVYLNPWLYNEQLVPAVPPTFVLRRGHGSGLERAYVFLALLQQMGIDGCLIGPPDAATRPSGFAPLGTDGKPRSLIPPGPFWAVGARIGADIQLYEPWRGERVPGTLAQVKANPDLLKAWFDTKTWPVSPDDVKQSCVFLAVPVSSLAPRLAVLEDKLKADSGVRLAVKPDALRDRFLAEAVKGPAFPDPQVKFWNPPEDRFSYTRILPTFLPMEDGGLDRAETGVRLHTLYHVSMLPRSVVGLPPEIKEAPVRERLVSVAASIYDKAFFAPPSPRERIQRGQFQEAARYLAGRQEAFTKGRERLRQNPKSAEAIAEFARVANEVYEALSRARNFNPSALPQAEAAVSDFWNRYGGPAQLLIDEASARAGLAEASFLIALCKQEEAEQQQTRRDLATGTDASRFQKDAERAWKEADNAWESLPTVFGKDDERGYPGRAEHIKMLAARAKALKGKE